MAAEAVGVVVVTSKVTSVTVPLTRSAKLTPHSELLPHQPVRVFLKHHPSLQTMAAEVQQQPVAATNAVDVTAPDLAEAHIWPVMGANPERWGDR